MLVPITATAQAASGATASALRGALTCAAGTAPGRPITFDPPVGLAPRTISVRGVIQLRSCSSPGGSAGRFSSGQLIIDGTAYASCTAVSHVRGQGRIIWLDAAGHRTGTSILRPAAQSVRGWNPSDAFLSGKITSGPFAGRQVEGRATPTTALDGCALRGLSSMHGTGRMTIS
ncbi:hypothetical protein [Nonomuraea jabiensis]|uniref:hypothetical protein n=1 Tax=Nonomuraea jabiensis TaxID=882448 RepID=UPI0036C53ED2